MSSSSGGNMPRLGPAWRSSASGASRGFQPPPAVPDERASSRERSGSHASGGSGASGGGGGDKNRNPFAMLDDEDDGGGGSNAPSSGGGGTPSGGGGRFSALRSDNNTTTSRPYHRAASGGAKPGGRSLADLAAGLSSGGNDRGGGGGGDHHSHHHHSSHHHQGHRPDHRSLSRSSSSGMPRNRSGSGEGLMSRGEDRPHRKHEGGRFEGGKYVEAGDDGMDIGGSGGSPGAKVIRYTREKLLSLRGRGDEGPPEFLKALEGSVVISAVAQDPVCWDTFDPDEIWAAAARDRRATDRTGPKGSAGRLRDLDSGDEREERPHRGSIGERGSMGGPPQHRGSFGERGSAGGGGFGSGRWQRGMAIPDTDERPNSRGRDRPTDRSERSRNDPNYEVDNPDDLWDDPVTVGGAGPSGAASDFSAFGGSLDDGPRGKTGMDTFELSDMSKAAAAFENELHGGDRKGKNGSETPDSANGTSEALEVEEAEESFSHHVDASRPLASSGTTIRSGSGDHVNVFEDFGDEASTGAAVVSDGEEPAPEDDNLPIKSGSAENNASSRLMKMIGVSGTGEAAGGITEPAPAPAVEEPKPEVKPEEPKQGEEPKPAAESVPLNPWGAPATSVSSNPWGGAPSGGSIGGVSLDSFGRDQQAAKEAEAAAQRKRQEEEQLRLQQQQQQAAAAQAEEEEKKRWAAMQAKQQAEMQAAQQRQQEQVKQQQNQVELVLIERISNILENSWGRSDLNSILSTLHANDSRVIAILSTIEALRALMARHPQRIQLGRDPTMGAEMAALRLTNAQWQAHQAQQAQLAAAQQQAAQQEELQRRQRQLQEEQARQQQEAMARAQQQQAQREAEERKKQQQAQAAPVITDAPWFYADPQGNIQGPFGGDEMRQWLEAGYFKGDLPISQNQGGPFRALSSYFSDASNAFKPTGPSEEEKQKAAAAEAQARAEAEARDRAEAEAAAAAQARAEAEAAAATQAMREKAAAEEAQRRAAAEAQARAEAEANARAEAEAQARAEAEKAASQRTEQSAQLKMMLGLGAGSTEVAGPPQPEPVAELAPAPQPEKTKKGKKKQKEQQQQQQPVVSEPAPASQAPVVPEPAPAGPPPAPAWGGVAAKPTTVGRKKSMSEIQQEEAREAARRAKELGVRSGGGGAGGWANIAATGGSTAWGGAAKTTAAAVVTPVPAVGGLAAQKAAAWNTPGTAPAAAGTKQSKVSAAATASSKKAAVDNFGANGRMTPTLEAWCKEQMTKINGSDDLTLVQFCMTLTDRDEIKQYLTAYLGSTPQVNSFAAEFIKRKGLGDNGRHHEEWESAGGSKKGRKKKGGK